MISNYFNEMTKSSPEACFLVSQTGELLAANPSGARMLGTDSIILKGWNIADFVTDPSDTVSRYLQICSRNREPVPGALQWRASEGRTTKCRCNGHLITVGAKEDKRLVLLRCEPRETESNRFIALNKTLEQVRAAHYKLLLQSEALKNEIAERLEAEGAFRESQERLLTILDSLDAIVYVADMKTYEIIFVNKHARDLFGDIEGKICWQTLQAEQTGPCDFCTNNKIVDAEGNPTNPYKWEFRNTKTERWYYIVDRAARWVDDRIVRLEIATDITERKRAERVAQSRLRTLEATYTPGITLDDTLRIVLDEIEAQTGSVIGFYNFLEEDQETLTLKNFSTNTLATCTAEGKGGHSNISKSVWFDCVREKRPVIHNDYASLPHRKGLPPGHAPIIRELVVPIIRGDRIVAIIGVGNKPTDYNETDVQNALLLGDFSWEIVERKRAEDDLLKLNEVLEQRVKDRTAELERKTSELERANRLFVGRELRMMELKEKIRELENKLNNGKAA